MARRRQEGRAVGTVQATVTLENDVLVAEVAWVVATPHQRQGYAREAAGIAVRGCGSRASAGSWRTYTPTTRRPRHPTGRGRQAAVGVLSGWSVGQAVVSS